MRQSESEVSGYGSGGIPIWRRKAAANYAHLQMCKEDVMAWRHKISKHNGQ